MKNEIHSIYYESSGFVQQIRDEETLGFICYGIVIGKTNLKKYYKTNNKNENINMIDFYRSELLLTILPFDETNIILCYHNYQILHDNYQVLQFSPIQPGFDIHINLIKVLNNIPLIMDYKNINEKKLLEELQEKLPGDKNIPRCFLMLIDKTYKNKCCAISKLFDEI